MKYNIFINSNLDTLIGYFKYSDKFNIINDIDTYVSNNEIHTNIDIILKLDVGPEINNDLLDEISFLNIPIIGIGRISKEFQMIFLLKNNINVPLTYYHKKIESNNHIISLLKNTNDLELFVIKISTGAKGLGQALLNKNELIHLFESSREEINYTFNKNNINKSISNFDPIQSIEKKEENTETISVNEQTLNQYEKLKGIKCNNHDLLVDAIMYKRNFIIQKYIKNRIEWRMLWFYENDPIIILRNRDKDAWQANACNNSKDSSIYNKDAIIQFKELVDLNKLNKVFNKLNTPFLSVDVYYDLTHNKFGIFEFQMEFGYTQTKNIPYDLIQQNIVDSTYKLIQTKLNETKY